ncbi:hypothetical protein B0H15DRAFT_958574, partial [Mycena belliarum]
MPSNSYLQDLRRRRVAANARPRGDLSPYGEGLEKGAVYTYVPPKNGPRPGARRKPVGQHSLDTIRARKDAELLKLLEGCKRKQPPALKPAGNAKAGSSTEKEPSKATQSKRQGRPFYCNLLPIYDVPADPGPQKEKASCVRALGSAYPEEDAVGSFQDWESEVLVVWALHCYHRHGRCPARPYQCANFSQGDTNGIIRIPRKPAGDVGVKLEADVQMPGKAGGVVKREEGMKREGSSPLKRETSVTEHPQLPILSVASPASRTMERARSARVHGGPPPSYTPVPPTDSDDSGDEQRVPLFDPDTPDERSPTRVQDGGQGGPSKGAQEKIARTSDPPLSSSSSLTPPSSVSALPPSNPKATAGKGGVPSSRGSHLASSASQGVVPHHLQGETWRAADEAGQVALGTFYTDIANLYILKYGYDLQDQDDLEVDVEDPVDPNAK